MAFKVERVWLKGENKGFRRLSNTTVGHGPHICHHCTKQWFEGMKSDIATWTGDEKHTFQEVKPPLLKNNNVQDKSPWGVSHLRVAMWMDFFFFEKGTDKTKTAGRNDFLYVSERRRRSALQLESASPPAAPHCGPVPRQVLKCVPPTPNPQPPSVCVHTIYRVSPYYSVFGFLFKQCWMRGFTGDSEKSCRARRTK